MKGHMKSLVWFLLWMAAVLGGTTALIIIIEGDRNEQATTARH